MVIAPPSFAPYGGQIIAALSSGDVVALNPANGNTSTIGNAGQEVSDLVFGPGEVLFIAVHDSGNVQTVTAAGVFIVFASGISGPDGLAADRAGNRIFVSADNVDTVYAYTVPGAVQSTVGTFTLDNGWAPTGLAFDGTHLIVSTQVNGHQGLDIIEP